MPPGAAHQPRAPKENYGIIPWTKVGGKFHFLAQVILCKFPIFSHCHLSAKAGKLDSPLFFFLASPLNTSPVPVRSCPECAQVSYSTDQYDIKTDSLRGKPESNFLNPPDLEPQARNLRIAAVPRFPGHILDVFEFILTGVPRVTDNLESKWQTAVRETREESAHEGLRSSRERTGSGCRGSLAWREEDVLTLTDPQPK